MNHLLLIMSLTAFISLPSNAQEVTHDKVLQAQQNIQQRIKGTLDGAIKIPKYIQQNKAQLVFPQSFNRGVAVNPWSQNRQPQLTQQRRQYQGQPKGNPWAPVGDYSIPMDKNSIIEKNPYTDNSARMQMRPAQNHQFNNGFNHSYQNSFNSHRLNSNGFNNSVFGNSFSTPFGDNLWPSNQFWPGSNNGNAAFPFMPW